jgi:hypothetical protein
MNLLYSSYKYEGMMMVFSRYLHVPGELGRYIAAHRSLRLLELQGTRR